MQSDRFNDALGVRLRAARRRKGMSLTQVEAVSRGEFKASVLGAYERGDRALSVRRLVRLAQLYGVHPGQLLPGVESPSTEGTMSIDLDELAAEPDLVERFIAAVRLMREEKNEAAVRQSDLLLLSSMVSARVPATGADGDN
ncbi:MAG TPA: helix-turn-helix domain-containing protein [Acidimicrobiia bacterium]|nr:helix-turn-helix domain-containing protein [Acidimicrobiia bacterium]